MGDDSDQPRLPPTLLIDLEAALGGRPEHWHRLSGGASRSTWSFDVADNPLILQLDRSGALAKPGHAASEAALVTAARANGVPAPEVLAHGADKDGAEWLVVARVEGETIPRRLLRDPEYAPARSRLAGECAAALAGIHAIDADSISGLVESDQLEDFGSILHSMHQPRPALELALRWLARTKPPVAGRAIVHGDFRLGNLLVDPTGLVAVLDWELTHIGDPLEDLGWLCVRAWRFGAIPPVGGFGERSELIDAYREASGRDVSSDALDWWEALGTFKWAVMCMLQASAHLSGITRSVELAAIGRRICENEWDLLTLMGATDGVKSPDGEGGRREARFFGRPSALELVEATREFLADDVMGETAGRLQFQSRIAANALAIVERELRFGPEMIDAHEERLATLGFNDDADLVKAIRSGSCDDDAPAIAGLLAHSVSDQLYVANPRYRQTRDGTEATSE